MKIEEIYKQSITPVFSDPEKAKQLGQYFTSKTVSVYMANMIEMVNGKNTDDTIRILDAGAGEGILAASAVIRCISLGYKKIHVTLYEIDDTLVPYIKHKMMSLQKFYGKGQISIVFEIRCEDFILSRPDKQDPQGSYDIAIINPPYFKYSVKKSPYSKATSDLFRGDPNIYASFIAVCLSSLSDQGQLIFITPRSFTNGLYYKGFRHYLFHTASLKEIHIFKSRNKVFKDAQVLQENIICKFIKMPQHDEIIITSSHSDEDINYGKKRIYSSEFIIDGSNDLMLVHIPESDKDAEITKQANELKYNFTSAGYHISTGPVVEHRTREYVCNKNMNQCVPLLRSHNIKFMTVEWSGKNKKDVRFSTKGSAQKHLLKNKVYVILKRFSSKDEEKRLVSAVYTPDENFQYIGIDNKLNYITRDKGEFSKEEAVGLSAVLNSSFMDNYFRCFSGNTQVNATEIRIMKFPSRSTICEIGKSLITKNYSQETIDTIVMESLFQEGENNDAEGNRKIKKQ